ncbi:hypothetical protein Cgig2_020936 [Carnegiea gigantea]|uniref:Membrane protein of ER body-like protein n=1 Tax=Carnegiea gigantea TaxID=171969 RepID=A0A9Q1GU35_9CARY|nr:hypothetical protein Cgig2_020936 [Carnegiea gigantea]
MEGRLQMRNGEEEEVMGMDLKTRRRSHHSHKLHTTSSRGSESSITSDSSDEDVLGVENNRSNGTSNGENSTILESGSPNEEAQAEAEPMFEGQKGENLEDPNRVADEIVVDFSGVSFSTNEGINGLSFHQNGDTIDYSLLESDAGSQEIMTNSSSLSKSPDTAVGLKDLESWLDESSNNLNFAATDAYSALEDTLHNARKNVENENVHVNLPKDPIPEIQEIDVEREMQNHKHVLTLNNSPKSVGNDNGYLNLYKGPLPEVEEFDVESVERMIQKQETHDFYCPNCNSCITKRVILKRRKRKIQEISPSEDVIYRHTPAPPAPQTSDEILKGNQENVSASVDKAADEPIYAITCLSCFSIFLPTQNGWLRRIFGRKPGVPVQLDASLTEKPVPSHGVPEGGKGSADANIDDGKGNVFPLWILNCCQPSREDKRPVRPGMPVATKQEPEPGHSDVLSEDNAGLGLQMPDTEPPLTPPDGTKGLEDKTKPHSPLPDETPSSLDRKSNAKPDTHTLQLIEPVISYPRPSDVPDGDKLLPPGNKPDSEDMFAPWFLKCCQPHRDGINRPHLAGKADTSSLPEPEPVHDAGVHASLTSKPTPSTQPDHDIQAPHEPEPPTTRPGDKPFSPATKPSSENEFALWFLNCCEPYRDGPHVPGKPGATLTSKPEPIHDAGVDASLTSTKPLMTLNRGISLSLSLSFYLHSVSCISISYSASLAKPEPTPGQDTLSPSKPISSITPGGGTTLSPTVIHVTSCDGSITPPSSRSQLSRSISLIAISCCNVDNSSPRKPTPPLTPDGAQTLPPELKPPRGPDDGAELTIPMPNQEPPKTSSPPTILGVIQPGGGPSHDLEAPLLDPSQEPPTPGDRAGVDIIKAIVYGGLLECITSLSVITSAAGGDATTLNIVALGLANVFGGLVLLFHNLRVLKHEHGTERYVQQLGRPGYFCLHATVAVISYLIFGLMAPIIYGFCFRKSDNKDYKLTTLAAASLVSITVLSTAKACVRSPPKAYIQTVFYYISVGFMVSGVGYVAGDFINMLLKKLGVFDSRSAPPEAGDMKAIWASY